MEHSSGAGPATRAALDVGSVIADTYRIEALIGRGGMGAVFVASHLRLPGKRVAIKLLHAGEGDAELLARFRREAEIATRLGHPNIVAVHDFNLTPDGTPYLVLEYLEGATLAQRIAAGPMPFEDVAAIVRQVGGALAAAHAAGIVHRDLKPQNVFLVMTDVAGRDVEVAKVLDFGISKIRGSSTVKTQESALLGTPQYMAPEQATGRQDAVDQRTDVFALGAIVHEMIGGRPAFSGASIPEVVFKVVYEPPTPLPADVPPAIAAAIARAMAKAPEDRFDSVGDFIEALTGAPLRSASRPAMPAFDDAGPGSARRLGQADALAHTMDSGNTARPAATAPVSPSAPTVDSVIPPAAAAAPPAAPAARVVSSVAHPAPPRGRRLLRVLLGVGAAGTVLGAVLAIRNHQNDPAATASAGHDHSSHDHGSAAPATPTAPDGHAAHAHGAPGTPTAPGTPGPPRAGSATLSPPRAGSATPSPAAVTAPESTPAVAPPAVAPPAGQPTPPRRQTPPPPAAPPPADDADEPGPLREIAATARDAFASGDHARAGALAMRLISEAASGSQLQGVGLMLRGKIACGKQDEDRARSALRQLSGRRGLRRQLLDYCRSQGSLTGER